MPLFGPPNVEKLKTQRDVMGLVKALSYSKNQEVQRQAAEALGQVGDARAVEPLVVTLQDPYSTVRLQVAAAESLGKIGDGRAVEPLVAALKHPRGEVRRAAGAALRSLNWQPADNMHRALLAVASSNWGEAALLGSAAVEPLVSTLQDKSDIWNLGARRAAAETLATIGDERAVEPFIVALQDQNMWVRRAVAVTLGTIGDARAVEPLVTALQDENEDVRYTAAEALGKIGDVRAVEALIAALQDRNWVVRRVAAASLGKIGDARAVKPLTAALQDGEVRRAAAQAIGQLRDAHA